MEIMSNKNTSQSRFNYRYMLSESNIVELLKQHNCKMTVILLTEDMCEKKSCSFKSLQEQEGKSFS